MLPATELRKSYSDQTGRFLVQSSRGYQYVMILYDYDSNVILSKPLKRCQASELTTAWTKLHEKLRSNCVAQELQILDNECLERSENCMSILKWSLRTVMGATRLKKEPSKPGRITSAPALPPVILHFRSHNGTFSCLRPKSL